MPQGDPPQADRPAPGSAFAFVAIGDFGTGGEDQYEVAERMCEWHDEFPFEIVITTGDNVYPVGQPESFDAALYEPYGCLIENDVRFHASLGNHDVMTDNGFHELNEPFLGMGEERNYIVRRGGVRFVIADSNSLDLDWLRGNLTAGKGDRWTVVAFHHPVLSPGSSHGSTPGFLARLAPLFSERGVDLVLNGHDHIYAATREVRGVRYVVTGGGGAPLYGCEELDVAEECIAEHHFLYVSVERERLTVTAVGVDGESLHSFEIAD